MDTSASPGPSSASSAPEPRHSAGAGECPGYWSVACELACKVLCAVLTCAFAAVGSVVGAVAGSVIGLATESGVVRGAGIGAISGAVFSIEVAESSRDLWHSTDSAVWSLLYMVDIIFSLLSGRLVREKVGPAVQSAVQSQISARSSSSAEEPSDLFETGGAARGLPAHALRRLPEIKVAADTAVDAAGDALCCSVCLQDMQVGEAARRLPGCRHVFHAPCIDRWLLRQASCPLCRRDI
ncbi:NEP1-interacting protein-like 1 [Lolium rigidum]|uniref:NEP1-interacting protein-like 1 n=1 Tax=Lolium rigidum TaxID=89674 RepID=UPI001F5C4D55|nr:NEP1-interacting protein-like 1 [Lolium rigidum]